MFGNDKQAGDGLPAASRMPWGLLSSEGSRLLSTPSSKPLAQAFDGEHLVAGHSFLSPMFLWTVMVVCQFLSMWCEYFWCPVVSKLSSQRQLFAFHVLTKRWVLNREEDILIKCDTGIFLKGTYEGYIYSVLAFLLQLVCIVYILCVVVDL